MTHTYEASCPDGELPLWGLLSWNTETAGSSYISFSVRYVDTLAELTGGFTEIGRATSMPDTQTYSLFAGGAGCPVDITSTMSVSLNKPAPVLELEMHVEPNGEAPVLKS